ncbi:MAG: tRNA pseudouridine(55) synthase TruB [Anaerolineales bacterium]
MNGLLNVAKAAGMSSHDVVNVVRRLAHTRRVGHTGTLDPLATGVLVLLVGPATRLARFFSGAVKSYRAVARLGETTTTYDAEGEVVERCPVTVTRGEVVAVLEELRGDQLQIPPMYSAVKVRGEILYKLARQGKEVERPPRPVTVYDVALLDWSPPELTFEVTVSAGTYVRTLAHDLGQRLGCGAHLRSLTRLAAGQFRLEQSYTLDELRVLADAGRLEEALLPAAEALELPAVRLTEAQVQAVRHGQQITLEDAPTAPEIQAQEPGGRFVAVLIPLGEGVWRPNLVLNL